MGIASFVGPLDFCLKRATPVLIRELDDKEDTSPAFEVEHYD